MQKALACDMGTEYDELSGSVIFLLPATMPLQNGPQLQGHGHWGGAQFKHTEQAGWVDGGSVLKAQALSRLLHLELEDMCSCPVCCAEGASSPTRGGWHL